MKRKKNIPIVPKNNGDMFMIAGFSGESDFVDGLVIAVVDAVAALDALDIVDGELLLLLDNGAVGALGLAGAALDTALSDHICHDASLPYLTSPLRST